VKGGGDGSKKTGTTTTAAAREEKKAHHPTPSVSFDLEVLVGQKIPLKNGKRKTKSLRKGAFGLISHQHCAEEKSNRDWKERGSLTLRWGGALRKPILIPYNYADTANGVGEKKSIRKIQKTAGTPEHECRSKRPGGGEVTINTTMQ